MKCSKCQSDNPEGMSFCRKCGMPLQKACPNCGYLVAEDDNFCGRCGRLLNGSKAAPHFDVSAPHSYTPKFLAEKILTSRSIIEGERKLVTVLFADVANFTSLSEKLDPEEIHGIMDGCFKILMEEIHKYEGTINQFTGDGIMALFGAPLAHEDHAQRACYASLAIQDSLLAYGERLQAQSGIEFRMRIGLNSGPVVVGAIGDDLRMDYTAIGDTINLAARMESIAQPGTICVSDHTHRLARSFFTFTSLGGIPVKGKEEPQEAYVLLGRTKVKTRIEASMASGLTRFVGRDKEISVLADALSKAKSGQGQVVGVVGEAGVGKSRILLELRNLYPDCSFLEGRCFQYGAAMAYLPLLDILRSYFSIKEGERPFVINKRMKDRLVDDVRLPPLQDLLSLEVPAEYRALEPREKRERIFEALRDLLIRESEAHPLILIIEDLHWIDKTSEEFLDYLIGWLATASILLILLYRPEYTHRWGSRSYFTTLRVDQLSSSVSAQLVQSILSEGDVVPELKNLILSKAAGNPLFMEELTYSLLENGSIQKKEDRYYLARNAIDIPDTVQGIISARIDRLDESLKRIMHVASVIGREFAFRILQSITDMREDLKGHLINLQGLEFIYEKRLFPELEFIFKHALTQEVAYNSLLLARRKEIHGRIARAVEELYPDRLDEFSEMLAYHYSRSTEATKGVEYAVKAAARARSTYAYTEAARLLEEALKTQETANPQDKGKRCDLLFILGEVLIDAGEPKSALDSVISESFDLAVALADRERASRASQLATAALKYWGAVCTQVWISPEAEQWVERADQYAEPGTVARVWADSAKGAKLLVDSMASDDALLLQEGIRLMDRALDLARRVNNAEVLWDTACWWLVYCCARHRFQQRLELARELAAYPRERVGVRIVGTALLLMGVVFAEHAMRKEADECFAELKALAEQTRQSHLQLYSLAADGVVATMDGRLTEAAEISFRIRDCGSKSALTPLASAIESVCGLTPRLLLGNVDEAAQLYFPLPKGTTRSLHGTESEITHFLDRWVGVALPGDDGGEDHSPVWWNTMLLEAAVRVRHRQAADRLLHLLAGCTPFVAVLMGQTVVARHVGAAAALLGRADEAHSHYDQALEVASRLGFRPEIALTRLHLAELIIGQFSEERPAARDHLDYAIAEFEEMKMQAYLERALKDKETIEHSPGEHAQKSGPRALCGT